MVVLMSRSVIHMSRSILILLFLGEIAKSYGNFNVKVSDSHVKVNPNVSVIWRNSHGTGQSNVKESIKSPMLAFIKEIYKLQAKLNANIGTYSVTCLNLN